MTIKKYLDTLPPNSMFVVYAKKYKVGDAFLEQFIDNYDIIISNSFLWSATPQDNNFWYEFFFRKTQFKWIIT